MAEVGTWSMLDIQSIVTSFYPDWNGFSFSIKVRAFRPPFPLFTSTHPTEKPPSRASLSFFLFGVDLLLYFVLKMSSTHKNTSKIMGTTCLHLNLTTANISYIPPNLPFILKLVIEVTPKTQLTAFPMLSTWLPLYPVVTMAQQLRALPALPMILSLIPSNHMVASNM